MILIFHWGFMIFQNDKERIEFLKSNEGLDIIKKVVKSIVSLEKRFTLNELTSAAMRHGIFSDYEVTSVVWLLEKGRFVNRLNNNS